MTIVLVHGIWGNGLANGNGGKYWGLHRLQSMKMDINPR
jgi:hypothetical protein